MGHKLEIKKKKKKCCLVEMYVIKNQNTLELVNYKLVTLIHFINLYSKIEAQIIWCREYGFFVTNLLY